MAPARGDSKPCTHAGCAGNMHFKREVGAGQLRWVCDENAQHK
jgi:hypothetical protein